MSEDVETTFEHSRRYLEDSNSRLFWFRWDAKSSFDAFLEYFLGNWIEFSLNRVLKKRLVRICESGMRNCPWCVRSMSLFRSREFYASCVRVGRYINYIWLVKFAVQLIRFWNINSLRQWDQRPTAHSCRPFFLQGFLSLSSAGRFKSTVRQKLLSCN